MTFTLVWVDSAAGELAGICLSAVDRPLLTAAARDTYASDCTHRMGEYNDRTDVSGGLGLDEPEDGAPGGERPQRDDVGRVREFRQRRSHDAA